jgi:hypothetical protein
MKNLRNIKGKVGSTNDFFNDTIIFIILTVAFFSIMLIVVLRAGSDVASYEQKYAKEISLLIDSSMPGTVFSININELDKIMAKNGRGIEDVFKIENNKVTVQLSGAKGYSFPYFSDYEVHVSPHNEEGNRKYADFYVS